MNLFLGIVKIALFLGLVFFVLGYIVNSFFVVFPSLSNGVDFYLEYMDYLVVFAVIVLIAYSIYSSNKRELENYSSNKE